MNGNVAPIVGGASIVGSGSRKRKIESTDSVVDHDLDSSSGDGSSSTSSLPSAQTKISRTEHTEHIASAATVGISINQGYF